MRLIWFDSDDAASPGILRDTFSSTRGDAIRPKANLRAMLAIYFTFYNFCRIHSSIRCTPAIEAGITKSVWTLKDLLTA